MRVRASSTMTGGEGGVRGGEEELRDLQCMRMRCEEAGGAKRHEVRRGRRCDAMRGGTRMKRGAAGE